MANLIVANGGSAVIAPTLGNILALDRIKITIDNVLWSADTGYLFSQASSTSSLREFGAYRSSGFLRFFVGGSPTDLDTPLNIFGSSTIDVETLSFDLVLATGQLTVIADGVEVAGSPFTVTVGASRDEGCLFRMGARASGTGSSTESTFFLNSGEKYGDVTIETDDGLGGGLQLVRTYVIPSSGTNIPDTTSGQDGTLTGATGDGSDFESLDGPMQAPVVPNFVSLDIVSKTRAITLSGTYTDMTPTSVEWREVNGETEIQSWANVDSFGAGVYSLTATLSGSTNNQIEVRATDGVTTISGTSNQYTAGIGVGLVGSSSSENFYTDGSLSVAAGYTLSVKARGGSVIDYTDASGTVTGADMVRMGNSISAATGENVGFFAYGVGGTRITEHWQPGQATYDDFISEVSSHGLSVIIDQSGYNDAAAGITVTQSNISSMYAGYRSEFNCPVITGLSQRRFDGTGDAVFIALWQNFQALIDANSWLYPQYRIDLELSGDNVHLTTADAALSANRFAETIKFLAGEGTYYKGPRIANATYVDQTVTVNLSTVGTDYTAISPTSAIAGFQFEDDTGVHTLSSVTSSTKNKIEVVLGRAIDGTLLMQFAGYDSNVSGSSDFANYPATDSSVPMAVDPIYTAIVASEQTSSGLINTGLSLGISIGI